MFLNKMLHLNRLNVKYLFWLTVGMILFAIPGFLTAPYGIINFDESYQILNALDWRNAVYSPLSSWLGNLIGQKVNWVYLKFRYLSYSLLFISVYVPSIYSLINSSDKKRSMCFSIPAIYLLLILKGNVTFYGWDTWTYCLLSIVLVMMLSLIRRFTLYKLLIIGFLSGILILLRLPNIIIVGLIPFIISLLFLRKIHRKLLLVYILIYWFTTILTTWVILTIMFGSLRSYILLFQHNEIGQHTLREIIMPYIYWVCSIFRFMIIIVLGYRVILYIENQFFNNNMKYLVYLCIVFLFFSVLWFPPTRSMINYRSLTIGAIFCGIIYCYCALPAGFRRYNIKQFLKRVIPNMSSKNRLSLICLILLSLVVPFGSNCGLAKTMMWPVVPILVMLFRNKWNNNIRKICCLMGCSLFLYSLFYVKDEIEKNTIYFNNDNQTNKYGFVLQGMRTSQKERGDVIKSFIADLYPYRELKFKIIPLKAGNEYIWEYLVLERNPFQRHNFNNWYAFWDLKYVEAVRSEIKKSSGPILVVYLLSKDEENPSLMYKMLSEEMKCVLDTENYSFWEK